MSGFAPNNVKDKIVIQVTCETKSKESTTLGIEQEEIEEMEEEIMKRANQALFESRRKNK